MSPHSLVLGLPPVLQQSILNQQGRRLRITSCLLRFGGQGRGGELRTRRRWNILIPAMKFNSSSSSSSSTTTATRATSTTGAAADDVVLELELGEIKDKYIKWNWKGQYAINYVVSHPDEDANINAPPILLVHGFGASVPHWRRFNCMSFIFFWSSASIHNIAA